MTNTRVRKEQYQFIKFLAFFIVFIWHCDTYSRGFPLVSGIPVMGAVSLFICLSGFFTGYRSVGATPLHGIASIKKAGKKIGNLYPLYLYTVLYMVMFSPIPLLIATFEFTQLPQYLLELGKHVLLLQSWVSQGYFAYNTAGWFFADLCFLYLLTQPLLRLVLSFSENGNRKERLILLFLAGLCISVLYCFLTRNLNYEFWHYVFPPSRLGEYFTSLVLGVLCANGRTDGLDRKQSDIWITVLELVGLGIWGFCAFCIPTRIPWAERTLRWLVPNYVLILAFLSGEGAVSKLFRNRHLRMLGDLSTEAFLINPIIILTYHAISGDYGGISVLGNLFSISFCLLLTLYLSYLLHQRKPISA